MIAVLADVHANLHAFESAIQALRAERPDRVVLLGDLVGYNAYPNECVELAAEVCHSVVRGNHDQDALSESDSAGTHSAARRALHWTRSSLSERSKAFLGGLPMRAEPAPCVLAVHGCFISEVPYQGYVTSTMLDDNLDALQARAAGTIGLCGHTHTPMVCHRIGGESVVQRATEARPWPTRADAVLINPGSVGQPRDGDPRLSFALVDTERRQVTLRRVEYDVEAAARGVVSAGLPVSLAQRLKEGR